MIFASFVYNNWNCTLFSKRRNIGVPQMNRANYTNKHSETYRRRRRRRVIELVKSKIQCNRTLLKRNSILLAIRIFWIRSNAVWNTYPFTLVFSYFYFAIALNIFWENLFVRRDLTNAITFFLLNIFKFIFFFKELLSQYVCAII